jgi:transcriptional regulator with XRE-family HTH domain
MNAKEKKKINSMIKELGEALKFENEEDRIEVKASFIQIDILKEVKILMKEQNISRTELALKLKKSKSFVSQLFSGDKALNLKMIAQFQEIFNAKFIPSFKNYSEYNKFSKNDYADDNYVRITTISNLKDYEDNKAA